MTDDEVIEKLREILKQYGAEDDKTFYALNRAIVAVGHMIQIPVTDGLPWHDGDYLVTIENSKGERSMDVTCYKDFDGIGYCWGIEAYTSFYKVLAWAELPPMWEG